MKIRSTRIPGQVLDRADDFARMWCITRQEAMAAACRAAAYNPPDGPVSYRNIIYDPVQAHLHLTDDLYAVVRHLEGQLFYKRVGWMLTWGMHESRRTYWAMLNLSPRHLESFDRSLYEYWLLGGQPPCLPTTARAPGVNAPRRKKRSPSPTSRPFTVRR